MLGSQKRNCKGTLPYICFVGEITWQHCQYYLPQMKKDITVKIWTVTFNEALVSYLLRRHHKFYCRKTSEQFLCMDFSLSSLVFPKKLHDVGRSKEKGGSEHKCCSIPCSAVIFVLWVRAKHRTAALSNWLVSRKSCKEDGLPKGQQKCCYYYLCVGEGNVSCVGGIKGSIFQSNN